MLPKFRQADSKAVALIIVIFAMMVFAILGWTLTVMQSTDFEANLRNYDSERSLSLAEAGAQWMLNQLSINTCSRTRSGVIDTGGCSTVDTDCNDAGDWLSVPHTLGTGQYNICCRNPAAGESGNAVIEARGYMPSQSSYRSSREVKVEVTLGSFDKVLLAKNLFDWTAMHAGSRINGTAQALYYERDGDGIYNELGVDYDPLPTPVLPADGAGDDRLVAALPFPTIDMSNYETWAGANTWAPPRTAVITGISTVAGSSRLQLDTSIFNVPMNQWDDQALRNITLGSWTAGSWGTIKNALGGDRVDLNGIVSWSVGDRISVVPKIVATPWNSDADGRYYTVDFSCNYFTAPLNQWQGEALKNFTRGTWAYSDWCVIQNVVSASRARVRIDDSVSLPASAWAINDWTGVVKRYRDDVTGPLAGSVWYIKGDVIFDVRDNQSWEAHAINGDISFRRTGVVLEGDAGIRGVNRLEFSERPNAYPNLATKNGSVVSPDTPDGGNESQRRGRRSFQDIIYTENGTVDFNYLNAAAVYGNNVTFDGQVVLTYDNDLTQLTGFTWGLSNLKWAEQ